MKISINTQSRIRTVLFVCFIIVFNVMAQTAVSGVKK